MIHKNKYDNFKILSNDVEGANVNMEHPEKKRSKHRDL
jgi:hypothetical protein